jgi:PAS domain S-box-containing protein
MLDLRQRPELVADILRSSSDCIKVLDLEGALVFMSEGGQRVMEIDDVDRIIGCPWPDFWQDEGNTAARAAVEAAKAGRHASFQGVARTGRGRERWWDVAVSPVRDQSGEVVQILSISRDITDLKEAVAEQEFLMQELAHRVKNSLTVVGAIAAQTFRDAADRAAVTAFEDRLAALARAHDTLLQKSWSSAQIVEVADAALRLHADGSRFAVDGPEHALGPKTALTLALLLHELATNAVKHGALSAPTGRVDLDWRVDAHEGGRRLALSWRERGGPPATAPARKGFGSRIIGLGLGGGPGSVVLAFEPEGLSASFSAPAEAVAR